MEHLRHNHEDRKITLTAIGKIGKKDSIDFLLELLWEREKGIKHLAPRQKDEIKIAVLNILGKTGSSELTEEIEKFVKQRGKGLMNLLVKDKVLESANEALKTIESRNKGYSGSGRKKMN